MITNEEARKAIEKYQKALTVRTMGGVIDVTAISSKEGADLISQTIEKISKQVDEDTELWCICEMAKMYMQGVKPVYPVKLHDEGEDFAKFVAKWVVDDDFQENADVFAELACRKLHKLGIVEIDGDTYKLKEEKEE